MPLPYVCAVDASCASVASDDAAASAGCGCASNPGATRIRCMTCDNLRRLPRERTALAVRPSRAAASHTAPIANVSPYEVAVGLRYTRARKGSGRNSFISFISLISMAGIGLGVAALIVVLSVMNGFQKDVRDRMLSVVSHIEVFDASGAMANWEGVAKEAFSNPEVKGAAPYVESQGMLTRDDILRG